jgi:hypothetical protein
MMVMDLLINVQPAEDPKLPFRLTRGVSAMASTRHSLLNDSF